MIERSILGSRPSRLLADSANLLHGLDIDADRAVFVPTSRQRLSDAAFVDGRSDIATGAPEFARLSELMRAAPREPTPDRFVFHLSFCGSTLLSRLIDVAGRSLVLKEPNCLVDLATWKTLHLRADRPVDRLAPTLSLARDALRRPFGLGETVTVKPSSWVNTLLDELAAGDGKALPVFITIDRAAFLKAVFRGGTERLTYTSQLAWHMASGVADGDRLLQAAVDGADDPLGKAANLAMVAHHLQSQAFERAIARGGWGRDRVIDFQAIVGSPFEAAAKACRALRLSVEPEDLEESVARHAGKHSKQPGVGYPAERRMADDRAVLDHHRQMLDSVLSWAEQQLGAELVLDATAEVPPSGP